MATTTSNAVSALNSMLQGELSAVATYNLAIKHLSGEYFPEFIENRDCHLNRVPVLTRRITELGGTPETASGVWVGFTKLVERGASLLGTDSVIAALEQGEDIGLKQYRDNLDQLDSESQRLIATDLRPAQDRTHARLRDLKLARK